MILNLFAGPGGAPDECWTGLGIKNGNGYRVLYEGGRKYYVHRLSFEHFKEPVPAGDVVDHECHNSDRSCLGGPTCPHRACWNPAHLMARGNIANILRGQSPPARNSRKETCPEGHDYTLGGDGYRTCPTCRYNRRVASGEIKGWGPSADRAHCPQGHEYTDKNTYLAYRSDGSLKQRQCRECSRLRCQARRDRIKAAAA